jgi:hypothetical protein
VDTTFFQQDSACQHTANVLGILDDMFSRDVLSNSQSNLAVGGPGHQVHQT